MHNTQGDAFHAIYNERNVIADCLKVFGYNILASKVLEPKTSQEIINRCLTLVRDTALIKNRHDVIQALHFSGLSYNSNGVL